MIRDSNNGHATQRPKIALGECIVELQKLKRKYGEIQKAREDLRARLGPMKPGKYDNYRVVSVREVEVKAHYRRAHTRLLLAPKE